MNTENRFALDNGIFIPSRRPRHRNDEYDENGFDLLVAMQRDHFWYRGRHKLLMRVLKKEMESKFSKSGELRAIDLGGGCGGWLRYIHDHDVTMFQQLALGDSSMRALSLAGDVVGSFAARYQVDLLDLPWREEWDVIFLLDVLEHTSEPQNILSQIRKCLRPGGLLFVTTPALKFFWSYNDELARHQRRYCKRDFKMLAKDVGFELLRTDYFMFFLSPLLFLNRLLKRPPSSATSAQLRDFHARAHRIPAPIINERLSNVFSIEASLINSLHFPWGTSILAVFQR